MGILNSRIGCFSCSGDFPTFPSAFSISNSKLPETSGSFLVEGFERVRGLVSGRFDFGTPPSELMNVEELESEGSEMMLERLLFERLSAGGRDFISLALSREIVGAAYDVITDATYQTLDVIQGVPLWSSPILAFIRASIHPLNSVSFSALKMCVFCGVNVTAREVPGAGGTTLKINLLPVRLIFLPGVGAGLSTGDVEGFRAVTAVTQRCAVISITPFSFWS